MSVVRVLSFLFAIILGGMASAQQDWVGSNGPMSDEEFYRGVSCGAAPGGRCSMPLVKWSRRDARDLTVSIGQVDYSYPDALWAEISKSLDAAIAQVNAAGSAVRIRRIADGQRADVTLFLGAAQMGERIYNTGVGGLDGVWMQAAHVHLWWNDQNTVNFGAIVFARNIPMRAVRGIVLEELVQSTGLLTDIRNPYYNSRSIFAEDSNGVVQLAGQDVMALRRHYPRR